MLIKSSDVGTPYFRNAACISSEKICKIDMSSCYLSFQFLLTNRMIFLQKRTLTIEFGKRTITSVFISTLFSIYELSFVLFNGVSSELHITLYCMFYARRLMLTIFSCIQKLSEVCMAIKVCASLLSNYKLTFTTVINLFFLLEFSTFCNYISTYTVCLVSDTY